MSSNDRQMAKHLRRCLSALAGTVAIGWAASLSASDLGFYAGASFVQTKFDHDWSESVNATIVNVDDEDEGFKIIAGWRPLDWLALEASYADLGAASSDTSVVCVAAVGFPCPTRVSADVTSTQLAVLALAPVGDFDLFVRAGINYWDAKATISDGSTAILREDESDTDFVYGAGAQYRYQRLALRVEYEHIDIGDADAQAVSLGVTYSF